LVRQYQVKENQIAIIDILVISEKVPHDLFERAKIKVKIESAGDKKLAFCKIKVLQNRK
jgi:hypothetical protein